MAVSQQVVPVTTGLLASGADAADPLTTGRRASVLRIASVPSGHTYVSNVLAAARARGYLDVLPDPQPEGAPEGQWWPPVILGGQWIEANAPSFDVLHVHFGFESFSVQHLTDRVAALKRLGRPIVLTVHDLQNPQLHEQGDYELQLDVLVRGADELVTLTPGAAREIERRWGREATVIPHPWVAGADRIPRVTAAQTAGTAAAITETATAAATTTARGSRTFDTTQSPVRIGVHLRDLRPNIDALATVEHLLAAVTELQRAGFAVEAVIDVNERVRDDETRRLLCQLVDACPFAVWNEHPRFSDDELADSLGELDISVLPYRHGTHSGWLELCWDLGVSVLAPAIGYYAEQHDEPGAIVSFEPGSYESFRAGLTSLVESVAVPDRDRPAARIQLSKARMDDRQHQARQISSAQLAVYRRALGRVAA